jgi:hypothetical protein
MVRQDALTYRLRRFRVVLLVAVTLPWAVQVLLAPFFGWHASAMRTLMLLVVDGLLAFFAWRRPAGLAAVLVIMRLCTGAVLFLGWGSGVGRVYGAVLAVVVILLIAFLVPMWRPLRRERLRSQMERVDAMTSIPDRAALRRQAKIEERGYP